MFYICTIHPHQEWRKWQFTWRKWFYEVEKLDLAAGEINIPISA
jgi:hypothetical protein